MPADSFVCGLVLAAGSSSRLGQPKQLLPYRGATLLDAVLRTARECAFDQLLVTVGGAAEQVRARVDLSGAEVVLNESYESGCSSSIAAALAAVDPRCDVLVLLLGDQPDVRPGAVQALLAARGDAPLAICRYEDGVGHPFAFGRALFDELRSLHGDKAVWKLYDRLGAVEVPVAGPVPRDVDTFADHLAVTVPDVRTLAERLDAVGYLADEGLATAIYLALRLPQPLLLEGEAGVGKTEAARALAQALGTPLIRLQCYEGLDSSEALYEWNYPRQLLRIRLAEAGGEDVGEEDLFGREYLVRRPVLEAIEHPGPLPAVLLVDELDRADPDFEAFLLEVLADAAVTIPELGTITAAVPPAVVLTSNRTRDLHDALKRRCLYHWIDYPAAAREVEIVRRRVPGTSAELAHDVVGAVNRLRAADVQKPPGIAEAIDWVAALELLGAERLDAEVAGRTLGSVLKYREDQETIRAAGLERLA